MIRRSTTSLKLWDTTTLLISLGGLVILSWLLLIDMTRSMTGMDMQMGMGPTAWSAADFAMMLSMWIVMMVGMMVPTAVRSVLIFSRMSASAVAAGHTFAAGHWFALGYIIAWSGFSVAATVFQWRLDQAALLSPTMAASSPFLAALILVGAGVWQLSPWKETCLRHCRSPMEHLAATYSEGIGGAIRMGIGHGLYCLGCCWVLMGLLFVGGVMNLICIGVITAFVLVEKLLPRGQSIGRIVGVGMVTSGLSYLAFSLQ